MRLCSVNWYPQYALKQVNMGERTEDTVNVKIVGKLMFDLG